MGRRDRQTVVVGDADGRRRHDLRGGTLAVGEMGLADLLTDGDDDALPADHGAEPERDRHRDLDPGRDELGRVIERALVGAQGGDFLLGQVVFLVLHQEADRLGDEVHVVAGVVHRVGRDLGQRAVLIHLFRNAADEHGERGIGPLVDRALRHVAGHGRARVAEHVVASRLPLDDLGGRVRRGAELRDLALGHRTVERVSRGHDADQDQHDQAHALLAVIGAVCEAHAGAGQDQQAADPQRRRLVAFRRLVEVGVAHDRLEHEQQQRRGAEANQRRQQQRLADLDRLGPVDAGGAALAMRQRIGDADPDDRADQGVGARGRKAEVPGPQIPDDGGDEEREHHGEAGAAADLEDQFHGQ